jgi:hypothetical protein
LSRSIADPVDDNDRPNKSADWSHGDEL